MSLIKLSFIQREKPCSWNGQFNVTCSEIMFILKGAKVSLRCICENVVFETRLSDFLIVLVVLSDGVYRLPH